MISAYCCATAARRPQQLAGDDLSAHADLGGVLD
jgi:hypothetical protein